MHIVCVNYRVQNYIRKNIRKFSIRNKSLFPYDEKVRYPDAQKLFRSEFFFNVANGIYKKVLNF